MKTKLCPASNSDCTHNCAEFICAIPVVNQTEYFNRDTKKTMVLTESWDFSTGTPKLISRTEKEVKMITKTKRKSKNVFILLSLVILSTVFPSFVKFLLKKYFERDVYVIPIKFGDEKSYDLTEQKFIKTKKYLFQWSVSGYYKDTPMEDSYKKALRKAILQCIVCIYLDNNW